MDVDLPLQLLGGLSPKVFMRRHWQKKPLLVRQAIDGSQPVLDRAAFFALASRDYIESRLVIGRQQRNPRDWELRHGPFARRKLPGLQQKGWTLLVQGVDLFVPSVHVLLGGFRFAPEARLDDVMVSYASDGGGVGPHFDSYDVFLLQVRGRRRWRIGRQSDLGLAPGLALKILHDFRPEQEFELDAGDMLYLPPRYAHDGVAMGECMTYSVGFKAPKRGDLAGELLQRLAHDAPQEIGELLYRDAGQPAVSTPGAIPRALFDFAVDAVRRATSDPVALERVLGEFLTEPKAQVWFEQGALSAMDGAVRLDPGTRMMYDQKHVFVNGESYHAAGRDAVLMRLLADQRWLAAADLARASAQARDMLLGWCQAGWVHVA